MSASGQTLFVRTNQLGFLPHDPKLAVILSHQSLADRRAFVLRAGSAAPVYTAAVVPVKQTYGKFEHCYRVDFSPVTDAGVYTVRTNAGESLPFAIGSSLYGGVADSLLLFFRVQRCGPAGALLHGPCHTHDITGVAGEEGGASRRIDATGGWHDAGDYVKFLNTTAYAAYTLLFSYEFAPRVFGPDLDGDGNPKVLDEAEVGLKWLLKLRYGERQLITQVQDLRDHDQGWRLPENDQLSHSRPGFAGMGKNLIGILCAAFAAAYRTWTSDLHDRQFADQCLTAAEDLYSLRKEVPDLDASGSGMYRDAAWTGKMALGAVELYLATGRQNYLADAKAYAAAAGPDYWWSWGNVNSYAHFRLASLDKRFAAFLRKNLVAANDLSREHPFGEAVVGRWGSSNAMLGVALQAILWKRLTGEKTFDTLAARQRDFILGANPWGVSFVSNIGKNPAKHFHSQVAYFHGGYLPGALAAGPVTAATLAQNPVQLERADPYLAFQSEELVYRDDRMDFVTNEPTIAAAATAVFVMGWYANGQQEQAAN